MLTFVICTRQMFRRLFKLAYICPEILKFNVKYLTIYWLKVIWKSDISSKLCCVHFFLERQIRRTLSRIFFRIFKFLAYLEIRETLFTRQGVLFNFTDYVAHPEPLKFWLFFITISQKVELMEILSSLYCLRNFLEDKRHLKRNLKTILSKM